MIRAEEDLPPPWILSLIRRSDPAASAFPLQEIACQTHPHPHPSHTYRLANISSSLASLSYDQKLLFSGRLVRLSANLPTIYGPLAGIKVYPNLEKCPPISGIGFRIAGILNLL